MNQNTGHNRLLTALRLAFYPAFEPASEKRFQTLNREASNARGSGDLSKSEDLYSMAMAEARASSDASHLLQAQYGLAQVYQDQHRYREAERIFLDHLDDAVKRERPNTQVHAAHTFVARLYNDEGEFAKAEEHFKAALTEIESLEQGLYCSTAISLARFYVEQHRYSEAEPLFQRILEIREDSNSDNVRAHHLQELAKVCEAQEKYERAEELYRQALTIQEKAAAEKPDGFMLARALADVAGFYKTRGRYAEAEDFSRRSLAIVEEVIESHIAESRKSRRRRDNPEHFEATLRRAQVPISESLDRLAEICECQEKYAEAEPLRKRSLEIKEQAWGEPQAWIWVDSLAAYANILNHLGREQEGHKLQERVEAIRTRFPAGSVRTRLTMTSRPLKKSLRWRVNTFVNAILHPSR
jgi:tetratricopeptide (TPR) repeat protein